LPNQIDSPQFKKSCFFQGLIVKLKKSNTFAGLKMNEEINHFVTTKEEICI